MLIDDGLPIEEGPTMAAIRCAYHEAAHVVVSRRLLGPAAKISVTIRSASLGERRHRLRPREDLAQERDYHERRRKKRRTNFTSPSGRLF
jgi:hypothetical protein